MSEQITAKGVALSMFKSISGFAKALGWSRSKASRVLSNLDSASMADIRDMCRVMRLSDPETIIALFFR